MKVRTHRRAVVRRQLAFVQRIKRAQKRFGAAIHLALSTPKVKWFNLRADW